MRKFQRTALLLASALALTSAAYAATPTANAPSDALVNAVIQKLQTSGALDKAVDSGITRYVENMAAKRAAEQQAQAQRSAELAKLARPVDLKKDHVLGPKNAEISLVEYSDVECPFCKRFEDVPTEVMKKFPGQVNWVWRFYPLPFHEPMASREAVALECATKLGGNEKFWSMLGSMMKATRSNGQGMPGNDPIRELAKKDGFDMTKFDACTNDKAMLKEVQADLADGTKAGVSGTPTTLIINHKTGKVLENVGYAPEPVLSNLVEQSLAGK